MNDALTSNHAIAPVDDSALTQLVARLPDLTSRTTVDFILAQTAATPPVVAASLPSPASPNADWRDIAIRYLSAAVLVVGVLAITVQWRYHRHSSETARQQTHASDRPAAPGEEQP